MNEAKLSYTIKVLDPQGWDELFTVRSEDPVEYFKRISALKKWLVANGYTPAAGRNATGRNATSATPAADDAPVCQYHGPMRPSKFGGFHCPKKLHDGTYCQSKSDVPPQSVPQVAQAAPPVAAPIN